MTHPFPWEQWRGLDSVDLARHIHDQDVTAAEVATQAVAAAEALDLALQAVLEVFQDVVEDPEQPGIRSDGPLSGVPMFMKDSGSGMAGRLREWGSRLCLGYRATEDDPLTVNLRRAGFTLMGRATLPEWGKTLDTTLDYRGHLMVTRNPWGADRTPGGSSGGSAALVAAGVVPIAKSGDAAGSTRLPAAFTGLVGLKPTRGLLPPPRGTNELTNHRIQEGVLTRSVRDQAAALDHMTRLHPGTHLVAAPRPDVSYREQLRHPPRGLRIAVSTAAWGLPGGCHPAVAARVRDVGHLLADLGHHVEETDQDRICAWESFWEDVRTGWIATAGHWIDIAEQRGWSPDRLREQLAPKNADLLDACETLTLRDHKHAIGGNPRSTAHLARFFADVDMLLCPVFDSQVPLANGSYSLLSPAPFDEWFDLLLSGMRYTVLANETGVPALAVPAGLAPEGLPLGAMLCGPHLSDGLLLRVAAQLEQARPEWHQGTPRIHTGRI